MLGNTTCARTSLFGTRSCQVMPKFLLRQRRWKVLNPRSWQEKRGPGLVTIQQRAKYAGLVHFHLGTDGQHLFPRRVSTAAAFSTRLFSSVSRERLLEPT